MHIRQVGDFTYALGERLGAGPSVVAQMTKEAMKGSEKESDGMRGNFMEITNSVNLPSVRIDGPYGAPAEDVFNSEVAVLIGAGIGMNSSFRGSMSLLTRLRCHTFCFHLEAYLVSPKERKARLFAPC